MALPSVPAVLRRSPELDVDDVVDMTRLASVAAEVTKDPGYEARLGFSEGFTVPPFFFSRKIFW